MAEDSEGRSDSTRTGSIQWDSSWPESAGREERARLLSYLEGRFGISPALFDEYRLFSRGKSWFLLKDFSEALPVTRLKVSKVGMKAFRKVGDYIKPTTRLIQIFGGAAVRGRVGISGNAMRKLRSEEGIPARLDLDPGYVILESEEGRIMGLGFYRNGRIHSQIPKKDLREAMLVEPLE